MLKKCSITNSVYLIPIIVKYIIYYISQDLNIKYYFS